MSDLSFIIPCYKSERTIEKVVLEILESEFVQSFAQYEIIMVDDGSPDKVYDIMEKMTNKDKRIKAVRLLKNFGQHAAMMAGLKYSSGDICVLLDDDGQCPVDYLKELVSPLYEGYDVSIAQYEKKKQGVIKNVGSIFNNSISNLMLVKPKSIQMSNYVAVKRVVVDEMLRYEGPFPYFAGLLFRSSGRVKNVPMDERERTEGRTTYTFRKLVSMWADGFTAFSIKPLRIASVLGACISFSGFLYAIILIINKLIHPSITMGWSSIMSVQLIIGGLILLVLGMAGEYIGRIYMTINQTPQYVVKNLLNIEKPVMETDDLLVK